jgi:type II restriction enzyme
MAANTPARDFLCESCGHPYELKATKQRCLARINDGAYDAMMRRIAELETPTFLLMRYSIDEKVLEVATVHRVFITTEAIFKRKPLPPSARRAGWVGCNIVLNAVPPEAKIMVVWDGRFTDRSKVRARFAEISALSSKKPEGRGWMAAVLMRLHRLPSQQFRLEDVYEFERELSELFPNNHHIRDKIRQQLQRLRDAGFIKFVDNKGGYRLTRTASQSGMLK